jgi:hypothetical protein
VQVGGSGKLGGMPNITVDQLLTEAKRLAGQTTAAEQSAITIFAALLIADAINREAAAICQAISSHR